MERRRYTTERGVTIGIVPIPLLLDKIREAHASPDAPTYTEHLAGGATQEVPITEAGALAWQKSDPETWAEHAEKWAAYQAEKDERTKALNDALWLAVMRRAIVVDLPADDSWVQEQALYGITVPNEPDARREHYIWTEVLGGQRDILRVMGLAAGADLTEEQLSAAEASFWNTLQRPGTGGAVHQGRPVADGPSGGDGAGSEGMGPEAI